MPRRLSRCSWFALSLVALAALCGTRIAGQQPPTDDAVRAFEVASVKANTSGAMMLTLRPEPGGRFTAVNVPVFALLRYAYRLPDVQILGGPDWSRTERFDVTATAGRDVPVDTMRVLVQRLLVDRFGLDARRETQERPVYELVMAHADRRLGPNLRQSPLNCDGAPPPAAPFDPDRACGYFGPEPGVPLSRARLAFRGRTMDSFVTSLMPMVSRPVINATGLSGYFDGELDPSLELPPPPPPPGIPDPFDRAAFQSIFELLPQQLGLKLASTRRTIDVLVIAHLEHPGPD